MNGYNKTETDAQVQRTNVWFPEERGWGRGDSEVQTTRTKPMSYKNVMHSTENTVKSL